MRQAEELIDRIVNSADIPWGKRRREIQRELRSHIEDFVAASQAAGRDPNEIEKLLLSNFGDPGQVARGFAWVYRNERRTLQAIVYTGSTVLLASSLFAAILAMQAGLAFSFGSPMANVFTSWHTWIEALDILASVAAYLAVTSLENRFEDHRFPKAALLLTAILTGVVSLCAAAGVHPAFLLFGLLNGIFFRAVRLFVTPAIARVAIVVICFPLAGVVSTLLRSPVSQFPLAAICGSWLCMGAGYLAVTGLASRVDRALLNGLQRMQAS